MAHDLQQSGIAAQVIAIAIGPERVADALRVPRSDVRLFGKPESFVKRRMGVALAFDADVALARTHSKLAAQASGWPSPATSWRRWVGPSMWRVSLMWARKS